MIHILGALTETIYEYQDIYSSFLSLDMNYIINVCLHKTVQTLPCQCTMTITHDHPGNLSLSSPPSPRPRRVLSQQQTVPLRLLLLLYHVTCHYSAQQAHDPYLTHVLFPTNTSAKEFSNSVTAAFSSRALSSQLVCKQCG